MSEPTHLRKSYCFDLTIIDPELQGQWWMMIDGTHFGFRPKIELPKHCTVYDGDILVHKFKSETEKFPQIRYFIVSIDQSNLGTALFMDNKEIKNQMIDQLLNYTKFYKRLPYCCKFMKMFKNGNIQIDYTPSKWDHFALNIHADIMEKKQLLVEDLKMMPETSEDPYIKNVKKYR